MDIEFDHDDDPLGALTGIIEADHVKRWSKTKTPQYADIKEEKLSRFPVREDINRKVALWEGDITKLKSDVVVNTTNESLNDKNTVSERIYKVAGHLLKEECRSQLISCRTGEAKITKGYELPARYVIHTVGPRYNTKYKTAAESALYMCYRNVFQIAREYHLKSIGTSVINTTRRGYPPEEGAHIGLRTVRRFLEKNLNTFDVIVFVVEPIDESIYRRLMPMYFPRSQAEEQHAIDMIPQDVGNEDGEPFIAERQIRIMDKPLIGKDRDILQEDEAGVELLNSFVGRHPFASVAGDHDQSRRARMHGRTPEEMEAIEQQRRYSKWVKRSRTEDFSDMVKLGFLYQSGVDYMGRPVVVFVGKNFPASQVDMNKAVSYFVHILDPIANRDYTAVYFHSLVSPENNLDMGFLRDVYEMLDIKFRRNLRALYVVHGTVWDRVLTWFFTIFSAATIKDKINFLPGVHYLYDMINPDQLEVPQCILEYDLQENGPSYYTPSSSYRPRLP